MHSAGRPLNLTPFSYIPENTPDRPASLFAEAALFFFCKSNSFPGKTDEALTEGLLIISCCLTFPDVTVQPALSRGIEHYKQ